MTDAGTPARTVRAADLPEHSVVATADKVWIKGVRHEPGMEDYCWQPYGWHNSQIDDRLAHGAEVLRYGTGREG